MAWHEQWLEYASPYSCEARYVSPNIARGCNIRAFLLKRGYCLRVAIPPRGSRWKTTHLRGVVTSYSFPISYSVARTAIPRIEGRVEPKVAPLQRKPPAPDFSEGSTQPRVSLLTRSNFPVALTQKHPTEVREYTFNPLPDRSELSGARLRIEELFDIGSYCVAGFILLAGQEKRCFEVVR